MPAPPLQPEIAAYNSAQPPGDKRICDALAKAIDARFIGTNKPSALSPPAAAERKIWHRHPVWFIDSNPIVGYSKLKGCVRLLFWSGRSFDEPGLAPEGTFQAAEARFTEANQIDPQTLSRWLDKSIEIQWDYRNLIKRKGRLVRLNNEPRTK